MNRHRHAAHRHTERLALTRRIRFTRGPHFRPGKRPGGARPRRNAVRRPWWTAGQIAERWARDIAALQPVLRRDAANAASGHRSRKNREALARIGVTPRAYSPPSATVVHGPVTVTVNERGTEAAAWGTTYAGEAVGKAPTVESIAAEIYRKRT